MRENIRNTIQFFCKRVKTSETKNLLAACLFILVAVHPFAWGGIWLFYWPDRGGICPFVRSHWGGIRHGLLVGQGPMPFARTQANK